MRLRLGWLVRCRSTIFIRFHPRRRSFHQLLLSFIFFSIEEERRLCDAKESQSTKPVSWSLTLSLIASCCSWESQEIPKAKPGKVSWSSPWLLLAALGRVRKYQRQSQEKSHDPLLHRFRKTAFTDSENTPTMQSQENHLPRVRKTTFRKSQENRLWSLSWWQLLLALSEQNYPEGTFNDSSPPTSSTATHQSLVVWKWYNCDKSPVKASGANVCSPQLSRCTFKLLNLSQLCNCCKHMGGMDQWSSPQWIERVQFLSDPGKPGVRSLGPDVCHWVRDLL